MMYKVLRQIHFSYGHRLLNHPGKCAHLHGHNACVEIELSGEKLDAQGMVMDFYKIRQTIGSWIDEALDHKMILCQEDPLVSVLQNAGQALVLTQDNPTAEVLAHLIFEEAKKRRLPVSKITLWESVNSCAVYHES